MNNWTEPVARQIIVRYEFSWCTFLVIIEGLDWWYVPPKLLCAEIHSVLYVGGFTVLLKNKIICALRHYHYYFIFFLCCGFFLINWIFGFVIASFDQSELLSGGFFRRFVMSCEGEVNRWIYEKWTWIESGSALVWNRGSMFMHASANIFKL